MSEVTGVDPKMTAGIDLLAHTGATEVQIRYSDDEEPTVWFAVAIYDGEVWETGAAKDPTKAVMRLCETLIDGGQCVHCHRPSAFEANPAALTEEITGTTLCWYVWNPELAKFRRGCE